MPISIVIVIGIGIASYCFNTVTAPSSAWIGSSIKGSSGEPAVQTPHTPGVMRGAFQMMPSKNSQVDQPQTFIAVKRLCAKSIENLTYTNYAFSIQIIENISISMI